MGAEATVAFLGRPAPVEVLHRDSWHIGALLGWRHDADGTCWLRVSALVDGYKRTAWVGLDTVRLPVPPARPRRPAEDDARTQRLPRHGDHGDRGGIGALSGVRTSLPALPMPRPRPGPGRSAQLRPAGG